MGKPASFPASFSRRSSAASCSFGAGWRCSKATNPIEGELQAGNHRRPSAVLSMTTTPAPLTFREQFWNGLEGDVDALLLRLDRFEKINAAVRRQAFTVIDGGLS